MPKKLFCGDFGLVECTVDATYDIVGAITDDTENFADDLIDFEAIGNIGHWRVKILENNSKHTDEQMKKVIADRLDAEDKDFWE